MLLLFKKATQKAMSEIKRVHWSDAATWSLLHPSHHPQPSKRRDLRQQQNSRDWSIPNPTAKNSPKNSEKKSDYQVTFTDSRGLWVQVKSGCLHTHLGNSNRRGTPSGVLSANTTKPLHLKKHYYHTDIFLNSIAEATEKKKKSQSIFIFLLEPKSLGVLKFLNFCAF